MIEKYISYTAVGYYYGKVTLKLIFENIMEENQLRIDVNKLAGDNRAHTAL